MIEFQHAPHGFAVAKSAGSLFNPLYDISIAHVRNDTLLGGVVYYDFTHKTICMHVAGFCPNWLSRDLLWVTFHYAFIQLGCASVFSEIRSTNKVILSIAKRIGYKHEVTIPEVFPDADLELFRLRKEDCKWLNIKPRGYYRCRGVLPVAVTA